MGGESGGSALKKGPWTGAEDELLIQYVRAHGEGNWNAVQKHSGLNRCGKSCRLRWANHLRPNLKKGSFSPHEERLILDLHSKYGNKWARMATQLPGRTDNEIKNYWNTRVKRRKRQGLPLYPTDMTSPSTSTWSTTPTPPTTPSNFPFQHQQMQPFSFQYRPVPLLSVPPPSFAGFSSYDSSSAASSHLPSPAALTPESHRHHSSSGGLLDDILDNLLDHNHTSTEMGVKEEGMNGLPEDLSKFLNFAPPHHHVAAAHWYGGDDSIALDMQQYFPVAASEAASAATTPTTNYSTQNPATWDSLPGIGKAWFKHN